MESSSSNISQTTATQTIAEAMQRAVACHRDGQLGKAEELYVAILQAQPGNADANHNLGVLRVRAKNPDAGLAYLLAAIESDPTTSQYWLSYIDALQLAGRDADARQVLEHARQHGLQGAQVDLLAARLPKDASAQGTAAGNSRKTIA